MKTGRITRTIKNTVRNNTEKGKNFKIRNWNGYNAEGIKEVTTAPAKKLTKLQKAKLAAEEAEKARLAAIEAEKAKSKPAKNTLERSPECDVLDISGEEQGFFKIGDKVFETRFSR